MILNLPLVVTRLASKWFVVVPVLVAFILKVASPTPWGPTVLVWLWTLPPVVLGLALLERGARARKAREGRPIRPGEVENEVRSVVSGLGALALAECIFVGAMDWRVGLSLFLLTALWVLAWVPPSSRAIKVVSSIDVRCSPQAAFECVSNPNNWLIYAGVELVEPVECLCTWVRSFEAA